MESVHVFTDASVSIAKGKAIGGYVVLQNLAMDQMNSASASLVASFIDPNFKFIEIETHKSNIAEIKTFIYVCQNSTEVLHANKVYCYSDCQALCELNGPRRKRLESKGFKNRYGMPLAHSELYQQVLEFCDKFQVEFVKVKGHKSRKLGLNLTQTIFARVDQLSRQFLRDRV